MRVITRLDIWSPTEKFLSTNLLKLIACSMTCVNDFIRIIRIIKNIRVELFLEVNARYWFSLFCGISARYFFFCLR